MMIHKKGCLRSLIVNVIMIKIMKNVTNNLLKAKKVFKYQ